MPDDRGAPGLSWGGYHSLPPAPSAFWWAALTSSTEKAEMSRAYRPSVAVGGLVERDEEEVIAGILAQLEGPDLGYPSKTERGLVESDGSLDVVYEELDADRPAGRHRSFHGAIMASGSRP